MPESKDAGDLAELRKLLTGPAEVGNVLPDAVRAARQKTLRDALQPLFERAFQVSVRNNPRVLADAIYPVIGPAVRRAISAALKEFGENVNQVVEKSASFRAVRWRVESRVTGRPFGEILLSRSLLYTVEQVFLIHRGTGLLLAQAAAQDSVLKDADMVASMLLPLQDYVSDSFTEEHQQLETLDVGRYKLWIEYGPKALLVGAVSGSAPVELRNVFRTALDEIHAHIYAELDTFQGGDVTPFEAAKPYLEACLLGQSGARKRRRTWWPWIALVAVLGLIAVWLTLSMRAEKRWSTYLAGLEGRPGLVIVEAQRSGREGVIRGLKDPDAPAPEPPPGMKVQFEWQRFLSLDTPWARERDFRTASDRVGHALIRFETGSARLDLGQGGAIDQAAQAIRALVQIRPRARVLVVGHTDEVGTAEANAKLSQDRAERVIDALVEEGADRRLLEARAAANQLPLNKGSGDWERASNRSVSFVVER